MPCDALVGSTTVEQLGYITTAADMDRVAADDSGGVLAVPALAGLAAPWWRPDAKATISGMTLSTTVGHLVVAILQGIAAQVSELGSAVAEDLARPLTRMRVDDLTQCKTLMQSVADLMQIDIEVYSSAHATPLGAAVLARMAHDPSLSLADAVLPWQPSLTYSPRWSAEHATESRGRWNAAAATT